MENISDLSRKYTFVSNHPLGAIDGVTLGMVLGRHYDGKIKYLVNDLLMNLKGLAPLCIPINKLGKQARNFPQMVENAFVLIHQVIMFPAGICSRRMKDGSIRDLAWSKTFIVKSVAARRDVVPIHFIGRIPTAFIPSRNGANGCISSLTWPCCFYPMKCTAAGMASIGS